ncbi:hypothetical protein TNCV_2690471 [Trichonephila clavipes]|uniref:Uncharacterized protein n=1 Tax=Trichonephila clavipes TaxID=2585209 RepID=A0A8X7BA83_TRICX|nr:hypothetical protein TNCV_2690471 [Trichonephila clavipes]
MSLVRSCTFWMCNRYTFAAYRTFQTDMCRTSSSAATASRRGIGKPLQQGLFHLKRLAATPHFHSALH